MTDLDREGALIYSGHDSVCRKRAQRVLEEHKLPLGLLFIEDVLEFGFNKNTGYMWIIQRNQTEHYFEEIDELVSYATEVSAYIEEGRMKKVRGIKARELVIWFPVNDITVGGDKAFVKSFANITKSFPVTAFKEPVRPGPSNRQRISTASTAST
ncbi:unnamed protein product [Calypogeia fissa]